MCPACQPGLGASEMSLRSWFYKRSVLSDLTKIRRLPREAQAAIAAKAAASINMGNETLPRLYDAATQDRHDALTQSASAAVILTSIEGFIFDHEHEKRLR